MESFNSEFSYLFCLDHLYIGKHLKYCFQCSFWNWFRGHQIFFQASNTIKSLLSPEIMTDYFDRQCSFSSNLQHIVPNLLAFKVSIKNTDVILMSFPFYMISTLSLTVFNTLSLFCMFSFYSGTIFRLTEKACERVGLLARPGHSVARV